MRLASPAAHRDHREPGEVLVPRQRGPAMTMQSADARELGAATNGEPRHLGVVRSYDDLHQLLRERAENLNVARAVLDSAAGVQDAYCAQPLGPRPTKRLGALSMGLLLQAL